MHLGAASVNLHPATQKPGDRADSEAAQRCAGASSPGGAAAHHDCPPRERYATRCGALVSSMISRKPNHHEAER